MWPCTNSNVVLRIDGLHPSMTIPHIANLLRPYGTIDRIESTLGTGWAKCYYGEENDRNCNAVDYQSSAVLSAQKAMANLDGRIFLGKRLTVQCLSPTPYQVSGQMTMSKKRTMPSQDPREGCLPGMSSCQQHDTGHILAENRDMSRVIRRKLNHAGNHQAWGSEFQNYLG